MNNLTELLCAPGMPVSKRLEQASSALSTPEFEAVVEMRHSRDGEEDRKVRSDSTQSYDPSSIRLLVSYRPRANRFQPLDLVVHGLYEASQGREWVSLKWFRDKYLPGRKGLEGMSSSDIHLWLNRAIEEGMILTGTIPNPAPEKPHTTTVFLNFSHQLVKQRLGRTRQRLFNPLSIRGEEISRTIIESRR